MIPKIDTAKSIAMDELFPKLNPDGNPMFLIMPVMRARDQMPYGVECIFGVRFALKKTSKSDLKLFLPEALESASVEVDRILTEILSSN